MKFGLIGEVLGHSYSKKIHDALGLYEYDLLPTPPEKLESVLGDAAYGGFNVTIPYKRAVIPFCADLSPGARAIGSVNTLLRGADGRLTGHNTDLPGFLAMLSRAEIGLTGKKVAVLGSGGTSLTARAACAALGARETVVVSRTGETRYDTPERYRDAEVLVNTTPLGMFPNTAAAPVDLLGFSRLEAVADVIYNPLRTRLVQQARALGVKAVSGLYMLTAQAVGAAELFTKSRLTGQAERSYTALRLEIENIVLIGMPGCGKTAVGMALAALTGRELLDTDALVAAAAQKSIPAIFAESGETAFRALEREAVAAASRRAGVIISTGGGAPLLPENQAALRENGRVYLLSRQTLATDGRPLSGDAAALRRMALLRGPFYAACADARIKNDARPEDAARAILEERLTFDS